MTKRKNLGWGSRLALIDFYQPSDKQASIAFGVPVDEIQTARELRDSGGAANLSVDIDPEAFGNPFTSGATSVRRSQPRKPAESATSVTPTPKRRGRKGSKINEAFECIGTEQLPAEEFATTQGVSLNVLRQAKRFDKTGLSKVRVKKVNGTLMVFRE